MNRRTLIAVLLVLATSMSVAEEPPGWHWPWRWFWHIDNNGPADPYQNDQLLTNNSGAKAELMRPYDDGKIWTSTGFTVEGDDYLQEAYEYDDFGHPIGGVTISNEGEVESGELCMASTNDKKFAAWGRGRSDPPDDGDVVVASHDLSTQEDPWILTSLTDLLGSGHYSYHRQVAIDARTSFGTHYVCVAYLDSSDSQTQDYDYDVALYTAVSTDDGNNWTQQMRIRWPMTTEEPFDVFNPVVALDQYSLAGTGVLAVLVENHIDYWYTTNNGQTWEGIWDIYDGAEDLSVAVWCDYVLLCWSEGDELYYAWSDNLGYNWTHDDLEPCEFPSLPEGEYAAPNVEFLDESEFRTIVTYEYWDDETENSYVAEVQGRYVGGETPAWQWFRWHGLESIRDEQDDLWNPSLRLIARPSAPSRGFCLWSSPNYESRRTRRAFGEWRMDYSVVPPPGVADNIGRNLLLDPDGLCQYTGQELPYVMSGIISGRSPRPVIVNPGTNPALAQDGEGKRWVAYLCDDTAWVMTGEGTYKVAFAGSSSAVPGQPSIVCYPQQVNGCFVSAVTFCVYDTVQGTTQTMFARVCSSEVIVDTIASVANLKDSLPCISVYLSDSLAVTWQHGTDTVFASLLPDYGPGTSGRPPAWSRSLSENRA